MTPTEFEVPPVVKTITYAGSSEAAFDRFTLGIGAWWPLSTHSLGGQNAVSVGFERLDIGGRLIERWKSGESHVWGAIVDIRRPSFISFTWHVGRHEDTAQLIELTFDPDDGWNPVLARYAGSGVSSA
jgi:hypothetical protein